MSVIASIADMVENKSHVRFVPEADSRTASDVSLFDHQVGASAPKRGHQLSNWDVR
jgi:hypothetical protein